MTVLVLQYLPQMEPLSWDDYLFVEADAYRSAPAQMLCARGYSVIDWALSHTVLARLCRHAPLERDLIMRAFTSVLYEDAGATCRRLEELLGPCPRQGMLTPPGRFAQLLILRLDRPRSGAPVAREPLTVYEPAPLNAISSWVVIQCVDETDLKRPVPRVRIEVCTAAGVVRVAQTDQDGLVRVDGIAPGQVSIRVLDMDGALWRPLEGPPSTPSRDDGRFVWHEVRQGECLGKIAKLHGRKDWDTIWEFRQNKDLRAKRVSPHVLYPGDLLAVPAPRIHSLRRPVEQTYTLAIDTRSVGTLQLKLCDETGEALSGAYELYWAGQRGPQGSGSVDGDGLLTAEVPLHLSELQVRLPERGLRFVVHPGWLDPLEDEGELAQSGAAARLSALGYLQGPGVPSEDELAAALAHFQEEDMGRQGADGSWDDATRAQLEQAHGT